MRCVVLLMTVVLAAPMAHGADGAVVIRIPDGVSSRCIDASQDSVWLSLRRLVITKEASWWSQDDVAGLIVNTTVEGATAANPQKVSFPRMVEAKVTDYAAGQGVSIPVDFNLLNAFKLQQRQNNKDLNFSKIDFDFALRRRKQGANWVPVLSALEELTKNLPLPTNPFTETFTHLTNFANKTIKSEIDKNNDAPPAAHASISLVFDPSAAKNGCSGDFEKTGTIAVVQAASGKAADGIVDIANANQYCWEAELRPVFTLWFGTKTDNSCTEKRVVRNNYYAFYLNAVAQPSGPKIASAVKTASKEALKRCEAHGIEAKACLTGLK